MAMNISIGNVIFWKVDAISAPENIIGSMTTTAIARSITILNAIIKILNFNAYSPYRSIKETLFYVNRKARADIGAHGDIK